MRNNAEWMIAYAAATLVGAIVVPINSWGKAEELEYAISDCGASLLVCDEQRYRLVDSIAPRKFSADKSTDAKRRSSRRARPIRTRYGWN